MDFEDFIIDNFDEIILTISRPTIESLNKEVDDIKLDTIQVEIDFLTDFDISLLNSWVNVSLKRLIEIEDYERCDILTKFQKLLNIRIKIKNNK